MRWTRRSFLAGGLAAAVWAGVPRRAGAIRVPGAGPMLDLHRRFSSPVRIESIEQLQVGRSIWFRVRSTDGAVGICPGNDRLEVTVEMARKLVIPYFLGKDARDIESLVDGVYADRDQRGSVYKYTGMPFWNAVGHVEAAVFDLLGRQAGVPVFDLLGGAKRKSFDVYISQFGRQTSAEEEVAQAARDMEKTGARATKLKIGLRMANSPAQERRDRRMIELARETFGPGVEILIDANGSYTEEEALRMGRHLEQFKVAVLEEPLPFQDYEGTRRVTEALDLTVAGGEQDSSLWTFEEMIRRRVVDRVQPDVMYCGGLVRSLRVARMAEQAGLLIDPHSPRVLPEAAANLHLCAVVPNLGPYLEYRSFGRVVGGRVSVPEGPGLGLELDEERLKTAKVL